jgi:hypothetical protein
MHTQRHMYSFTLHANSSLFLRDCNKNWNYLTNLSEIPLYRFLKNVLYPWVLHPVARLSNLASYDAVNSNKVPICQLSLFIFLPLTKCFGPYRPSSGENIQSMLYEDYSYYHGSAVRTQLDVCLRYGPQYMLSNIRYKNIKNINCDWSRV